MSADPKDESGNRMECPSCGYHEFVRMPTTAFIAFSKDYVCRRCVTRFRAPTPRWAAITFVACGLLLALPGVILLTSAITDNNPIGEFIGSGLIFFGVPSVWFGIQALCQSNDKKPS